MTDRVIRSGRLRRAAPLAIALGLGLAADAGAFEIEPGNPDLKVHWDNTLRYNFGKRVQAQDPAILANPNKDDGDRNFAKGSTVTNRLDLLSELDDKPDEVLQPKFINPDVLRWELHRVWVVEATLKKGQRHVYSRRTFYFDEDSWTLVASDQYDGRGALWRPGFSYVTQSYDVPAPSNIASGHYDLVAGTYYVNSWPGAGGMKVFDALLPELSWAPASLAGKGVR